MGQMGQKMQEETSWWVMILFLHVNKCSGSFSLWNSSCLTCLKVRRSVHCAFAKVPYMYHFFPTVYTHSDSLCPLAPTNVKTLPLGSTLDASLPLSGVTCDQCCYCHYSSRYKSDSFLLKLAAIQKLERLANAGRLKRIFAGWCDVARDSKRSKEYLKVWCHKLSNKGISCCLLKHILSLCGRNWNLLSLLKRTTARELNGSWNHLKDSTNSPMPSCWR